MKTNLRRISFVIGCAFCLSTPVQSGSLRDFTDSVYSSFTSSGGPENFRSASGAHVFTGGARSLRFGIDDIKVIGFEPPSMGASCSGIDFFAGSISFASRDEFIQAGRNIAAAATVYAFRLALASVCSSCNSIMAGIQAWVEKINQMANATCQNTLNALEEALPTDKIKKTNVWDGVIAGVDGYAETSSYIGLETGVSWITNMTRKGLSFFDLMETNPSVMRDVSDFGYVMAYNTDTYRYLFPWMDEVNARAATWSVLSEAGECPDLTEENPTGSWCGINSDSKHEYKSFIMGNPIGPSSSMTRLPLPVCAKKVDIETTALNKFTVCDFDVEDPVTTQKPGVHSIAAQVLADVFGTTPIKADGTVNFVGTGGVCSTNDAVNLSSDSMFSKSLRFSSGSSNNLTDSQAFVASLLGTPYSRDLYRMDASGKAITDARATEMTKCGLLAEMVYARTTSIIDYFRSDAANRVQTAKAKLLQDPTLKGGVKEIMALRLDALWRKMVIESTGEQPLPDASYEFVGPTAPASEG